MREAKEFEKYLRAEVHLKDYRPSCLNYQLQARNAVAVKSNGVPAVIGVGSASDKDHGAVPSGGLGITECLSQIGR